MPGAKRLRSRSDPLGQKSQLPLVANGEDSHFVARDHVTIEGEVSCPPVRDHKFPQLALDTTAYEGMDCQSIDRRLDRHHRMHRGTWILVTQKLERAFDMLKGACRVDYFRHGFGRPPASPTARRFIQAWTSSAR